MSAPAKIAVEPAAGLTAGVHTDVATAVYHADPCPEPSLSASIAWALINRSPAHARIKHPRLNPDFVPEEKAIFDLGSAAHHMVLRQAFWREEIVQIDAPDWRAKAAREKRDEAREAGLVPILTGQYEALERMVAILESHPQARNAFREGTPEVTLVWYDEDTGVWCRIRPDWQPRAPDLPWPDYKTTADAKPEMWDRRFAADHGGLLRAAFYEEGIRRCCDVADPTLFYVVQETAPPHAIVIRVVESDSTAMEIGRRMMHQAMAEFARCLEFGIWPSYDLVGALQAPKFMEMKWLEAK